jgi:hypothetical protein
LRNAELGFAARDIQRLLEFLDIEAFREANWAVICWENWGKGVEELIVNIVIVGFESEELFEVVFWLRLNVRFVGIEVIGEG